MRYFGLIPLVANMKSGRLMPSLATSSPVLKLKLWEDELKFNQDLNGDGDTGLVTVEAIGNAHLKHGDNTYNGAPQYYIVDGTDTNIVSSHIGLTRGGEKGPTSYTGWSATQVIASGAEAMRYFGLIAANMMSGRLMPQATSSPVLKLSYGKMN